MKLALTLAVGLFLTSCCAHAEAVQFETLLDATSSWDGLAYKAYPSGHPELSILKIMIPPHTKLNWHTHPMPNAAYVLTGKLTVAKKENGQKLVVTKGQTIAEMVDVLHRGETGPEGVTLIVFYAGAKDMPLSKPPAE